LYNENVLSVEGRNKFGGSQEVQRNSINISASSYCSILGGGRSTHQTDVRGVSILLQFR